MKYQMLNIPGGDKLLPEYKKILNAIKKDPVTASVIREFPDIYLVGGFIRDLMAGIESKDRDYVVIGPVELHKIKRLAERLGGSFFILKNLVRIVLREGSPFPGEIDITFTQDPIVLDLSRRDFTINSIAWSLKDGIIDPFGGIKDLRKRIVRLISKENIISDPVRILRAYRIAVEINGRLTATTRKSLSGLRLFLRNSPKERITSEFMKLLSLRNPVKAVREGIADNIFTVILDIKKKDLNKNLKLFQKLSNFYLKNSDLFPSERLSQGFSRIAFLRLVCLSYKKGDWLIRLSKKNQKRLDSLHRAIRRIKPELLLTPSETLKARDKLFDLFYEIKDYPEDIAFITGNKILFKEAERFRNCLSRPLVRGIDIARNKDIQSKHIGVLLKKLLRLQYAGRITNREEALIELNKLKSRLKVKD
jgi:tRNA nucleotidyltransferase (CCA-adding enzyme)